MESLKQKIFSKKISFYLKLILSGIIFSFLIYKSQLQLDLLYSLFSAPLYSCAIIALCYLMVIIHAWRWFRFNQAQGIALSYYATVLPTYLGVAFNTVLPGSLGGDFVRLYYVLKKFPLQKSKAVLCILVDRMSGLMGVFVIACLLSPVYLPNLPQKNPLFYLLIACTLTAIGIMGVFLILSIIFSERRGLKDRMVSKMRRFSKTDSYTAFFDAVFIFLKCKLVFLESLVVSIATQGLLLLVILLISKVMGLPYLSPLDFMLALVVGQVANLIPLTPGGVGLGEAAFANILLLLHPEVTAPYATIFFALRLLSTLAYLPGVLIGIFGFDLLHKNIHQGPVFSKSLPSVE